jgi:hypothetical protein
MHTSLFAAQSFDLFDEHDVKQVIECRFVEVDVRAMRMNRHTSSRSY